MVEPAVRDSDEQLVARVQKGDKRSFDLLVLKYQHKVLALVRRYVKDHAEAEDVAQESFVKAYRAIGSFRGDSAFYTWLYRIAVNWMRVSAALHPMLISMKWKTMRSVMLCALRKTLKIC